MGVEVEGFTTTVFPTAKLGATLCAKLFAGKLKGRIAPTTPSGSLTDITILLSLPGGYSYPSTLNVVPSRTSLASCAADLKRWIALVTSTLASLMGFPDSAVRVLASSSLLFSMISAAVSRIFVLSFNASLEK